MTNLRDAQQAMLDDFIKEGADLPEKMENEQKEKRSKERAIMLLHAYFQRWSDDGYKVLSLPDGKPYVEVGFAVDLGITYQGKPVVYVGRIDRVGRSIKSGNINLVETKTTGSGLSSYILQVKPNHQLTGYKWA